MSAYAPAILITLLSKPAVTQKLGIKVVSLKGRMVNVALGPFEKEEAMVVHKLLAAGQVKECRHVSAVVVIHQLRFIVSANYACIRDGFSRASLAVKLKRVV